jgi:PIN domain nuclease of toxin-antitoxin system
MKLLLDAHALLWFIGNDPQLSAVARENIESPATHLTGC